MFNSKLLKKGLHLHIDSDLRHCQYCLRNNNYDVADKKNVLLWCPLFEDLRKFIFLTLSAPVAKYRFLKKTIQILYVLFFLLNVFRPASGCLSIRLFTFSYKRLLLLNQQTNFLLISQECSLCGPLSKLFK